MPLEFEGDAISLSGLTGTWLKSLLIGEYYNFWWNITSGGERNTYKFPTAIVELDAATGLVYVKDIKQTILGSAGHALELKFDNPHATNLSVVLVENNRECYEHLKLVIQRKWPKLNIGLAERTSRFNPNRCYLYNSDLDSALSSIEKINLGNALFFFDPLRGEDFRVIEEVARKRIQQFYKTGTEFMLFVFTSDWFLGRDDFASLPNNNIEQKWSHGELDTVSQADALFGDQAWREYILTNEPVDIRESKFLAQYRVRLHKWFRYVLPMPFNPKSKQVYHLILCSNFEVGVRATRGFFCGRTGNPDYSPNNAQAFGYFKRNHPELFRFLSGNQRPLEWKILWSTITGHEEGICDKYCSDFKEKDNNLDTIQKALDWLMKSEYFSLFETNNEWDTSINQYIMNWPILEKRLGVHPPQLLKPLSLRPQTLKEIIE